MRDFKNVKVPGKYRKANSRVSVKRVDAGRARSGGKNAAGLKSLSFKFLSVALAVVCCWFVWRGYRIITDAEMFQISGIDVKGVSRLGQAELKQIAGTFTGQNIFRVNLEEAARRARSNPWIRDVRIHRSLPNRITMNVIEREPYAVLNAGGGSYLMDKEAVVIDRVKEAADRGRFPVIAMQECRALPGEPVLEESITEALTLLSEIETRGGWIAGNITIKAESSEALSIVYADHEFKIGSGMYAEKLRRLAEVMEDVNQRRLNIAYVDLRAENQAAAMVKDDKGKVRVPHNKRK